MSGRRNGGVLFLQAASSVLDQYATPLKFGAAIIDSLLQSLRIAVGAELREFSPVSLETQGRPHVAKEKSFGRLIPE